ncbi:hypothetical protein LCGC14_0590780 [marine sediment metagenome]|uniref:histidine kinase n=2 Tax=marine sediment metagenome TaxID=412755 RepID=A0A0F9RIF8_9ZZZZ
MTKKSLIESEDIFKELFNNMSSGVVVYEGVKGNKNFIIKDINKAGEQISQVKREEVLGKQVTVVFPGIKELGLLAVFQRVLKTGISENLPVSHYVDGRVSHWVENYVYKLPSGFIVAIYDNVTERRDAEEKLAKSEKELRKLNRELELRVTERTKELVESEKKFRTIFESIPDLFFLISDDGTYLEFSGTESELFDKPENFIGKKIIDVLPNEIATFQLNAIKKAIETKKPQTLEIELPIKDIIEYFEARFLYLSDHRVAVFVRNITDRKKMLEELRISSEIMTNLSEGVNLVDADSLKIVYTNTRFDEMFGYDPGELISKHVSAINSLSEVSSEEKSLQIQRSIQTEGVWRGEIHNIKKDGTTFWCYVYISSFKHPQYGNVFVSIHTDITERKIAEQKLKDSEEKYHIFFQQYKMLVESITDSVYVLDKDWNYILVNDAAAKLVQLTVDEMLNNNLIDLFPGIEETPFFKVYKSVMETKKMDRILNKFTHPDGRYGVYEVSVYPITEGILCIARDITEEKEIERKLKKSEEKYRRAYDQTNLYKDIFAHDINNILQNIQASAELSSLYLNNPEKLHTIKELYEIIKEQISRGGKLIGNVRKITHIEETEIPLKKIELNNVLSKAIEFLKNSYQSRNINIRVGSSVKKIYGKVNDFVLDVFENLLINSVHHNDQPRIEIEVSISRNQVENKKFIRMEFKDNGIGISDYRKKSIFLKGTKQNQRTKGMGLGLSLVKKIIDSYEGSIWVEDRIKGDYKLGSNFILLIPEAL